MLSTLAGLWLLTATAAEPVAVSVGYLGEFVTHPGVFAALEQPLATGSALSLAWGGRAGLYVHPRHHVGVVATGELVGRLGARGPYAEAALGLGLRHRFLAGAVYRADGDGVRRGVDFGRPGLLGTVAIGAGWHVGPRPLRVFARAEGWAGYPLNHRVVPGAALTAGVGWTP